MMNTQELKDQLDVTMTALVTLSCSINQQQFNQVPFEGSWTAGQLAAHMIKANSGFVSVLYGPVRDTERKPDELIERIRSNFSDHSIQMKSPDFILPELKDYDRDESVQVLTKIKADVIQAVDILDLTKTCMAFELPVYGYVTRLEAINFILYHTRRHVKQLQRMLQKLELTA